MDYNKSHSGRILIVDDTDDNIRVLGTILRKRNYLINVAQNGVQALKLVEKVKPDLILLDIMMPEMDGFDACEKLKESAQTKDIPIIFLSAKSEKDDVIKGFKLGAVDYITKPFNSTELLARVETHLELKFSRQTIIRQSEERKELLHILSHDLGQPILSVLAALKLVDKFPHFFEELTDQMKESMENGLEIISLVKEISVLEEQKINLELVSHNLLKLVQKTATMLDHNLKEKEIDLVLDIDSEINVFVEKRAFVNSVMNNLITNAIKFSFKNSKILIQAKKLGEETILIVKDSGIGMSEALMKDLFKFNKMTSRKGTSGESGTGFGMPLVKKFVTAFGGKIEVTSTEKLNGNPDHGTTIRLTLKS